MDFLIDILKIAAAGFFTVIFVVLAACFVGGCVQVFCLLFGFDLVEREAEIRRQKAERKRAKRLEEERLEAERALNRSIDASVRWREMHIARGGRPGCLE